MLQKYHNFSQKKGEKHNRILLNEISVAEFELQYIFDLSVILTLMGATKELAQKFTLWILLFSLFMEPVCSIYYDNHAMKRFS